MTDSREGLELAGARRRQAPRRGHARIAALIAGAIVLVAAAQLAFASGSPGSTVARCTASHLRISVPFVEGAVSHRYWDMALRNLGPGRCRLQGYPGVGLLNSRGGLIHVNVDRNRSFPTPSILVGHGQRAFFTFEYVVSGPCLPHFFYAYGLEVFPPNSRHRLLVNTHGRLDICDPSVGGNPMVTPMRATMQP